MAIARAPELCAESLIRRFHLKRDLLKFYENVPLEIFSGELSLMIIPSGNRYSES